MNPEITWRHIKIYGALIHFVQPDLWIYFLMFYIKLRKRNTKFTSLLDKNIQIQV